MDAELLIDLSTGRPPVRRPAETAAIGDLYLSSTGRARFRRELGLRVREDVRLGTGPVVEIEGRAWRCLQEVRIAPP